MFGICLIVFIGLCIYHASEPTLPADYHRNWKLEAQDADKVWFGEMPQREFIKNMNNGKYRWGNIATSCDVYVDKRILKYYNRKVGVGLVKRKRIKYREV